MNDLVYYITDHLNQIIGSVHLFIVELVLAFGFIACIAASLFLDKRWKNSSFIVSILSFVAALLVLGTQYHYYTIGFFGMLTLDALSFYSRALLLIGIIITSIYLQQYTQNKPHKKRVGDLYAMLIAACIGMNTLCLTSNWLLAFIALEMVSICSYIMVGYFAANKNQTEAAMKYALFGSACSAVMLYGLSLIYGFTGNLDFSSQRHIQGLIDAPEVMCSIALLFVFTGIGFKLSFVPFHLWTPDVYQGAPTPITAFLSTIPKIAAVALFARLAEAWISTQFYFSDLSFLFISFVAIVTMLVGNLIALRQTEVKRMMAYSSIGHTGFLMMAIISFSSGQQQMLLFYLVVYTLMNLASFGFIGLIEQQIKSTELKDYAGLGKKFPILFTCFSFVGIALIGLPPTAGFVAKLLVFSSIFDLFQNSQDTIFLWLLIVGALTSVISLFYYFKIPLYAFLRNSKDHAVIPPLPFSVSYVIVILLTLSILIIGIFPSLLLEIIR